MKSNLFQPEGVCGGWGWGTVTGCLELQVAGSPHSASIKQRAVLGPQLHFPVLLFALPPSPHE